MRQRSQYDSVARVMRMGWATGFVAIATQLAARTFYCDHGDDYAEEEDNVQI